MRRRLVRSDAVRDRLELKVLCPTMGDKSADTINPAHRLGEQE